MLTIELVKSSYVELYSISSIQLQTIIIRIIHEKKGKATTVNVIGHKL